VVVEIKSVAQVDRVRDAQMISYLKISVLRVGLILNFNVRNLSRQGVIRKVNGCPG
jgi:GxxExxY protein